MVGMKRPYPFSPEYPPVPAFHCKFPPGYVSLASRSPESASCSNECTASLESGNRLKRFDISCDCCIILVFQIPTKSLFWHFYPEKFLQDHDLYPSPNQGMSSDKIELLMEIFSRWLLLQLLHHIRVKRHLHWNPQTVRSATRGLIMYVLIPVLIGFLNLV